MLEVFNIHLYKLNLVIYIFEYTDLPKTQFEIECRCGGHSVTKKVYDNFANISGQT